MWISGCLQLHFGFVEFLLHGFLTPILDQGIIPYNGSSEALVLGLQLSAFTVASTILQKYCIT